MKYTAAIVALAAVVSAQTLADIPGCALPCLQKAVADDTSCSATDVACICKSFDEIQGDATGCIVKACGSSVAINKVLPAAQALCANPPSGGSGGETTTKAAETTTTAAAQSSGYQAPTTTKVAVTTAYSVSTMSAPASSGYAQPTGGNGTTPPATTTAFPGAAPVAGSIGGLAMLALGALAL